MASSKIAFNAVLGDASILRPGLTRVVPKARKRKSSPNKQLVQIDLDSRLLGGQGAGFGTVFSSVFSFGVQGSVQAWQSTFAVAFTLS